MLTAIIPETNQAVRRCILFVYLPRTAGASAGVVYFAGVIVAAGLLLYEHSLVKINDFSRLDSAFFTMNGVISIVFFGFVFTERLLR